MKTLAHRIASRWIPSIAFGVGTLLLAAVPLQNSATAAVIFDTICPDPFVPDPANQYNFGWDYQSAPPVLVGIANAIQFSIVSQSFLLDSVSVMIANTYQAQPNLGIAVVEDNSGTPSEEVVDWVAVNPITPLIHPQLLTFSSSLHPELLAGETYWLRLQPLTWNTTDGSDDSLYVVSLPLLRQASVFAQRYYSLSPLGWEPWRAHPSDTPMAVRIEGTVVPEPAVVLLLAFGGLGWFLFRQRRHVPVRWR
jgi:hypothetical protein